MPSWRQIARAVVIGISVPGDRAARAARAFPHLVRSAMAQKRAAVRTEMAFKLAPLDHGPGRGHVSMHLPSDDDLELRPR
jgi:hypothetical protein